RRRFVSRVCLCPGPACHRTIRTRGCWRRHGTFPARPASGEPALVNGSCLLIVKVGGSLLDWPELPTRLEPFLDVRRAVKPDEQTILIAGGGPVAELVRVLDRAHGLGDPTAHRLALRALDFTAALLAALVPRSALIDRFDALASTWNAGRVPVLVPRPVLDEME